MICLRFPARTTAALCAGRIFDTPPLKGSCRGTLRIPCERVMRLKEIGRLGFPGETGANLSGMEVRSMVRGDAEQIAARVAKRAEFRLHHVGTKLNERELGELEALRAKRGQTQGEFIRGLILAEIERDRRGVKASAELEEITAVRLLLVNLLHPAATGQPMPVKTFDAYIAETNKRKGEVARGIAEAHAAQP